MVVVMKELVNMEEAVLESHRSSRVKLWGSITKIGNVKQHWHGTKASNLLSILKQGLIIPPADSVHCTGRMFGNGIYGSEQSTKALNYATNYWNASGDSNQRAFMLVCDFAMGREFRPQEVIGDIFSRRDPEAQGARNSAQP